MISKTLYVLDASPARTAKDLVTTYSLKSGAQRTFKPHLHPRDIIAQGAFEGKMMNDCLDEFPRSWFTQALNTGKLSPDGPDPSINKYGTKSRQNLKEWNRKNWIIGDDERGWFQWFCRYALGRRQPDIDTVQMKRWAAIVRFKKGRASPKVRQLLLQWSWS